ncbi:MAG: DivIVA domain-containing protein [Candidatus Muiribacteriota bacterium]
MSMRITPLDIRKRVFSKSFRGYSIEEVDEFMHTVSEEFNRIYTENKNNKNEVAKLEETIKEFQEMEKTLKQALLSAQKTSGQLKTNAERECQLIIKEAELNAEKIVESAKEEAKDLMKNIKLLQRRKNMIKMELKAKLESYMEALGLNDEEFEKRTRNKEEKPLISRKKNGNKGDNSK